MADRSPRLRVPIGVFAGLALLAAPGARANDIEVTAAVEPATAIVGDVLRYVLTATYPAGGEAVFPAARGNTGRFEAGDASLRTDTLPDGRVRTTQTVLLTAWEPGPDTLPPQRVEARTADGRAVVLETPATVVEVVPVRASGVVAGTDPSADTLADIYDGERLPRGFPWALPPVLALLAAALWWWRKRLHARRTAPAATPVAPPPAARSPEETAFAQLDELERAGLTGRAFAFRLSEIQRAHLAAARGIDALEATTTELLERGARAGLAEDVLADLGALCARLDAVKFASTPLDAAAAAQALEAARALVARCAAPRAETGTAPAPTKPPSAPSVPSSDGAAP